MLSHCILVHVNPFFLYVISHVEYCGLQHVLDPSVRSKLVNVQRWFLTVGHQPQVSRVVGEPALCVAPPVFDPKKYQELTHKKVNTILILSPTFVSSRFVTYVLIR